MDRIREIVLTDLRNQLAELGQQGGMMNSSVYDTAQVLRLAPLGDAQRWAALQWLVDQQHEDGGWGSPAAPRARDVPTLASVLALLPFTNRRSTRAVVDSAIAFLRRQSSQWAGPPPDDLPVGTELLLPHLLDEAAAQGIDLPDHSYAALRTLGRRRRRMIEQLRPGAGTTPAHSWEAWGAEPDPALLDVYGSVGHSPSATAAWLHAAAGRSDLADARERATSYLQRAAAATGDAAGATVPTVYPFIGFEIIFGLYPLLIAGVFNHPALHEAVERHMPLVASFWAPRGMGMTPHFAVDGDSTAAGLAVIASSGRQVDMSPLQQFSQGRHYCAYHGELQPAPSVTARVAHTLSLAGPLPEEALDYLIEQQQPDGRWLGDKWNHSWLYTTLHSVLPLATGGRFAACHAAAEAAVAHQRADGGWGMNNQSNEVETSYAVLMLHTLRRHNCLPAHGAVALERARGWMLANYRPFTHGDVCCWVGKESYRPFRIDRCWELCALLALAPEEIAHAA
jgi:hypothetical protein